MQDLCEEPWEAERVWFGAGSEAVLYLRAELRSASALKEMGRTCWGISEMSRAMRPLGVAMLE